MNYREIEEREAAETEANIAKADAEAKAFRHWLAVNVWRQATAD